MKRSCAYAAMILMLAACWSATAAEPALQPQRAVVVLRNRHVLEGEVTPAGDYYLVTMGKSGQVRLANKDVEMVCRDLEEAYQRKAADTAGKSAAAHVDLADWCMRQSLHDHARKEVDAARNLDPHHPQIEILDQRLKFATTSAKPVARTVSTTATVGTQQLERIMKELPPGGIEQFTAVVQPILMDRCGAARCHGGTTEMQFQLLQPVAGKIPSRRFTQRNLFATLSVVDKQVPEDSLILEMSRKPHGFTQTAPFKSDEDRQYRVLAEWVHSLRAIPQQRQPATVTANPGFPQPQMGVPNGDSPAISTSTDDSGEPAATNPASPTLARDPFDPEIFNRRYHRSK